VSGQADLLFFNPFFSALSFAAIVPADRGRCRPHFPRVHRPATSGL